MKVFSGISLLLAFFSISLRAGEFELVREDGTPHAYIQGKPASPDAPEFTAALELQEGIEKISGARLERTNFPGPFYRNFTYGPDWLEIDLVTLEEGRCRLPEKTANQLEASTHADAFAIVTTEENDGKHLYIAGKNPIGILYGVYTFLEDYLGVRFFHAGEGGECWPSQKHIVIQDIDDFREPWCDERNISAWYGSVAPIPIDRYRQWLGRRKCVWWMNYAYTNLSRETLDTSALCNHGIEGGGHGMFEQAVPKKLFEAHPEYFPMKNGVRVCEERSQRCLSNPEVQKMVEDFAVSFTNYSLGNFNIMYHDSIDGWCLCDNCKAMGSDSNGNFSIPVMAHRFTSLMAERILKRNPQANVFYWMYSQYRPFPDIPDFKLDSRLKGTFCPHQRCYAHPFGSSECNKSFRDLFQQWKALGTGLGIFEYYCISRVHYTPVEFVLGEDMKYWRDNGVTQWVEDCTSTEEGCYPLDNWQLYYVATKLLWDADLDVDKLMDETYSIYYGKAAEPMKKYQALRRQLWDNAPNHAYASYYWRQAELLVDETVRQQVLGLLDEAVQAAHGDETLLTRIGYDQKYLKEFWIVPADKARQKLAGNEIAPLPVAKCTGEIKVDGILDEPEWQKAVPIEEPFLTFDDKATPPERTVARIMYDSNAFYFAVEARTEHAWSKLVAEQTAHDGEVWADDSVEFFIYAPYGEYFQVAVNTLGTVYDGRGMDASFDSRASAAAKVTENGYVIELRVPVEPMNSPAIWPHVKWRLHISRNCQNLQPPQSSMSMSIDGVRPHDFSNYREVKMEN